MHLPTNEQELYVWMLALMLTYIAAALALRLMRRRKGTSNKTDLSNFTLPLVFDGVTFAGSITLLIGIFDQEVLRIIGDTKPFLLMAGLAALVYSLHALVSTASK